MLLRLFIHFINGHLASEVGYLMDEKQLISAVASIISEEQSAQKRQLNPEEAPRFKPLDLLAVGENTTSRIVSFLLDPNETHRQGDLFLRLFVKEFLPEEWENDIRFDRVRLITTSELIDFTLTDGHFWIGCENTIFGAPEQDRQAGRYLDQLRTEAGATRGDYRLLYITPRGEPPSDFSLTANDSRNHGGKLVLVPWLDTSGCDAAKLGNVGSWLSNCTRSCRAQTVGWFVRHFSDHVNSRVSFGREINMVDQHIIDISVESQESLEAALRIGRNYNDVKQEVVRRALQGTVDLAKAWAEQRRTEGWEVITDWKKGSWIASPYDRFLPVMLRKKNWPMMGVIVMAGQNGPCEIEIAVMAPSRATWEEAGNSADYYGEWSAFVDDETRSRIVALKERFPELNKESVWEPLFSLLRFDGRDISDLRQDDAVLFVNTNMERLIKWLAERMIGLAKQLSDIPINCA